MQQYAGWEILGSMMISQMPKYLYLVGEMFPSHTNTESKVAQAFSFNIWRDTDQRKLLMTKQTRLCLQFVYDCFVRWYHYYRDNQ